MSENNLPNPGNYVARRHAPIVIGETTKKAIMAYIPYEIIGSDAAGYQDVHSVCIQSKDGELQQRNLEEFQKVFPSWPGNDIFDLETIPLNEGDAEFALKECFHEEYAPEGKESRLQFRAKWFNALNSDPRIPAPLGEDGKKKIRNLLGSKLKAVMGSPAKPAAKAAATPAPAPAATPAAPAAKPARATPGKKAATVEAVRVSNADEVYIGIQKKFPDVSEDDWGNKFFAAQDEVFADKERDESGEFKVALTVEEWGKIATHLGL